MKILFTGASSFTGYWFVRALAGAGHEVVATYRGQADRYDGVRAERVQRSAEFCNRAWGCVFGDDQFFKLISEGGPWDVLCHHAADVTDYKSPDFDVMGAVANNCRNLRGVLDALRSKGCGKVVLTGSVFENGEGAGSEGLAAFSPYGLSKAVTAQVFRYYAEVGGFRLGKFVIPNPFGPYEEPRFTTYLIRSWYQGKKPAVSTPDYIRDNIHVSLLAKAYVRFVEQLGTGGGFERLNPSGYVASQGAFARAFADQMQQRLDRSCPIEFKNQTQFTEPRVRINIDVPDRDQLDWDEGRAWDELADYYRQTYGG